MIIALSAAALIIGCVAQRTAPVETVFSSPVEIVLPTTQIADVKRFANEAEYKANSTIDAIAEITPANVPESKPRAADLARETRDTIRLIYDPLAETRSMIEVAADRIIEARGQTEDARGRLKESEAQRERDRVEAKRKLDKAEKQIEQLRAVRGQWLGYSIAGLGVLCLALGAIGLIGQKFIKLSFGAGAVGLGLIGIGLAVVNYAIWVSIIGVILFVAFIIGGTIFFVRYAKRESKEKNDTREAAKIIAKSLEAAVDAVDEFEIKGKPAKVMKAVQSSSPLAESLVDEAQFEMGKRTEPATSAP